MNKKKRPVGRPRKSESEKRKLRAVCWLDAADKSRLQDVAYSTEQSESQLIRAGLVEIKVLADR